MVSARGGRLGVETPGGAAKPGGAVKPGGADKPGGAKKSFVALDAGGERCDVKISVDSGLAGKVDGRSGKDDPTSVAGAIDGSGELVDCGVDTASLVLGFDSARTCARLGSVLAGVEGREVDVPACLRSNVALDWLCLASDVEEPVLAMPRTFRDTRGAPALLAGRGVAPPDITRLEKAAPEPGIEVVDVLAEPFCAQEAARGKPASVLSENKLVDYLL